MKRAIGTGLMEPELLPELLAERDALMAEIHAAFEGMTRVGGDSATGDPRRTRPTPTGKGGCGMRC